MGALLTAGLGYTYLVWDASVMRHRCSFEIDDEQMQERLVELVADAGISHEFDMTGQMWYSCDTESQVKEFAGRVMGHPVPAP